MPLLIFPCAFAGFLAVTSGTTCRMERFDVPDIYGARVSPKK
ncbi:hypothetical protein Z946_3607 [Sulfitobacter noctilucicola]|nr:hypothetical protein Z946_3607 [Sulfitobacter noctilucicola]